MLFPEEHENDLKLFLVQKIEKTPDADEVDAEVLADYVLALLKHDGDVESVRETCVASLPDFLGEGLFLCFFFFLAQGMYGGN